MTETSEQTHWDENSARVTTADETDSGGGWLEDYTQMFAVNQHTAHEQREYFDRLDGGSRDDSSAAMRALRRQQDLITRGFVLVQNYERQNGDRIMAERCMWLLLGFPTLAGAADHAALVRLLGREKATVNKCLQYFQSKMSELPVLPGQRTEKQKAGFSSVQKKIWHKIPKTK